MKTKRCRPRDVPPEALLALGILVTRGGACTYRQLNSDFEAWIRTHGKPTRTSVMAWWQGEAKIEIELGLAASEARLKGRT